MICPVCGLGEVENGRCPECRVSFSIADPNKTPEANSVSEELVRGAAHPPSGTPRVAAPEAITFDLDLGPAPPPASTRPAPVRPTPVAPPPALGHASPAPAHAAFEPPGPGQGLIGQASGLPLFDPLGGAGATRAQPELTVRGARRAPPPAQGPAVVQGAPVMARPAPVAGAPVMARPAPVAGAPIAGAPIAGAPIAGAPIAGAPRVGGAAASPVQGQRVPVVAGRPPAAAPPVAGKPSALRCPRCAEPLPDPPPKRCEHCHARLAPEDSGPKKKRERCACGAQIAAGQPTCTNCGRPLT